MKKLLCILLVVLMIFALCSCGKSDETSERFVAVEARRGAGTLISNYTETIFYDKETNVMYLGVRSGNQLAITVLLNADGTPMLYKP